MRQEKACGHCGHVHRITSSIAGTKTLDAQEVTYDQVCDCGCIEAGWRYDNGPTILDSTMRAIP